jgi:hypothetical protein
MRATRALIILVIQLNWKWIPISTVVAIGFEPAIDEIL